MSCVRFSPSNANPIIVSAGWDKTVKVWNLTNCKLKTNHRGHNGYINAVTVSPDGSLCASGGKVPFPLPTQHFHVGRNPRKAGGGFPYHSRAVMRLILCCCNESDNSLTVSFRC